MRIPLLLTTAVLFSNSSIADDDVVALDADAFLAAYRPALRKLEHRYQQFTCRAFHRRPTYDAVVEYAVNGSSFRTVQRYAEDASERPTCYPPVHVRCESEGKCFELSQISSTSEHFISGIGPDNAQVLRRYHRRYNKPIALAATHLFDLSMATLINSRSVAIRRVTSTADDRQATATVDFQLDPEVFRFHRAVVKLQSCRGFEVKSYKLFYTPDPANESRVAVYSATVDYQMHSTAGFEVPRRVSIQVQDGPEPAAVVEDAVVEGYEFARVPQTQFRLSNFGIDDTVADHFRQETQSETPATRVTFEAIFGQQVDVRIPVLTKESAYRVVGVQAAACSRVGCGEPANLPVMVPSSGSSQVIYRFTAQNLGTATIQLQLITDCGSQRSIPVELTAVVVEAP